MRISVLLLIGVMMIGCIWGQVTQVHMEHFQVGEDGARTMVVLHQAQDGFIWAATNGKLFRIDGKRSWLAHAYLEAGGPAVDFGNIYAIEEDEKGCLWIGTRAGLYHYNPSSQLARYYEANRGNPRALDNPMISALFMDAQGTLWVGTWDGLHRYVASEDAFERIHLEGVISRDLHIRALLTDSTGTLWLGTRKGVIAYNPLDQHTVFHELRIPYLPTGQAADIRAIKIGPEGRIWVAGWGFGLQYYEAETQTWIDETPRLLAHPQVDSLGNLQYILFDEEGTLWVASLGGVFRRSRGQAVFYAIHSDQGSQALNHKLSVIGLLADQQQNLWIYRTGVGLSRLSTRSDVFFIKPLYFPHRRDSLIGVRVNSTVQAPDGRIWVATDKGLGSPTPFSPGESIPTGLKAMSQKLDGTFLTCVLIGSRGGIWVGTRFEGMYHGHLERPTLKHYLNRLVIERWTSPSGITSIEEDWRGNIWISNAFALFSLNPDTDSVKAYRLGKMYSQGGRIRIDAKHKTIWAGAPSGLYACFADKDSFIAVSHEPQHSRGTHMAIGTMELDSAREKLWMGTETGLWSYSWADKQFQSYGSHFPVLKEVVSALCLTPTGTLWMGLGGKLVAFNPENQQLNTFDESEGMRQPEFLSEATVYGRNGNIIMGGVVGSTTFDPLTVQVGQKPLDITLHHLVLDNREVYVGEEVLPRSLAELDVLRLAHHQNNFSFHFSAPDQAHAEQLHYAYWLEGWNEDWQYVGQESVARFARVAPGTYRLHLRVAGRDMRWHVANKVLEVHIQAPWWDNPWAYTFYGILAILLVLAIRFVALKQEQLRQVLEIEKLKREQEHQQYQQAQQLNEMKTRFFDDVCHELRTPLSLILSPLESLIDEVDSKPSLVPERWRHSVMRIHRNADRLHRLVDQLLDLARSRQGLMQPRLQRLDLGQLVSGIGENFRYQAEVQYIQYHVAIPAETIFAKVDFDMVEKMLSNLLTNAFKYTPREGTVSLLLEVHEGKAHIKVKDTGLGIPSEQVNRIFDRHYRLPNQPNQSGYGIGLALTKELIELHHGQIQVESRPNIGTAFTLILPDPEVVAPVRTDPQPLPPVELAPIHREQERPAILIVEDNDEMRTFLKEEFSETYQVWEAINGKQGFNFALRYHPQLIISDVMMPEEDGFSLCSRIKTHQDTQHIPVIMLTAKDSDSAHYQGLGVGADVYLTKPFQTRRLHAEIQNLLTNRSRIETVSPRPVRLAPLDVPLEREDAQFLKRVMEMIETHIENPDFKADFLIKALGMSRTTLYEHVKAASGQSVAQLIREVRLKRAQQLLVNSSLSVTEISEQVGFTSINSFRKAFSKIYGASPSKYRKTLNQA